MTTRWARVARGLLTAVLATFVAALFHVAGGGTAPSTLAITVALIFAGLVSIAFAGRTIRLWSLSVSVAVSQMFFHAVFGLGQGAASVTAAGGIHSTSAGADALSGMAGMAGMGAAAAAGTTRLVVNGGGMSGMDDVLPTTAPMLLSHLAAAFVTIVAIRCGVQTLRALARLARLTVCRLVRLPVVDGHSAPKPVALRFLLQPSRLTDLDVLLLARRHRGPPAAVRLPA